MRPELFHPMFVHFPIVGVTALWIFKGLGLYQIFFIAKEAWFEIDQKVAKWILYPTIFFYVLSLYLGDIALDAVKSTFPYLYKINLHEELAQKGLFILLAVTVLDVLINLDIGPLKKFKKELFFLQWLFLCLGIYFLIKTSHSGASLVYEFQAGTMRGTP